MSTHVLLWGLRFRRFALCGRRRRGDSHGVGGNGDKGNRRRGRRMEGAVGEAVGGSLPLQLLQAPGAFTTHEGEQRPTGEASAESER